MKFLFLSQRAIQALALKALLLLSPSSSSSGPIVSMVMMTATAMDMSNMLMGTPLQEFLSQLVSYGEISNSQKQTILHMAGDHDEEGEYRTDVLAAEESKDELRSYLYAQMSGGGMEKDTVETIASTLSLGGLGVSDNSGGAGGIIAEAVNGPVQAVYDTAGEGNMVRLGNSNIFSSSGTSFHNGIWGYATGNREYALQCHGEGFAIMDVTDPSDIFRVQFVPMEGGGYWRDVATHFETSTSKTFAYVGAQGTQGGGQNPNLFVFDLSYLSGDKDIPNGENSDPIPESVGWLDLGPDYTGLSHTINVARGLLFLNTAGGGDSDGCNVYDLTSNPWDPNFLFNTGGSGRRCHDSFVREDINGRDILFISDGSGRTERIYDITNVDANWPVNTLPPQLGQTTQISGIYAHESWLSEDNRYLFEFDENNSLDIIVHDVSDLTSPSQIAVMQYSEQEEKPNNAVPHNGMVRGNYFYVAYYEAGLRVFDISNPYLPVEVGKVETHRDPNGDGIYEKAMEGFYEGAWNLYPFLPSKNILVNDMFEGLFVVSANAPYDAPLAPTFVATRDANNDVTLTWNVVQNARGYSVERSLDGETSFTLIAEHLESPTYFDSSVQFSDAYYKVTAINGEGSNVSSVVESLVRTTSPTSPPTKSPTDQPTISPTRVPTQSPSNSPTGSPTIPPLPTKSPTKVPTQSPTNQPSSSPTLPGICSDDPARRCSTISECSCGGASSSTENLFNRRELQTNNCTSKKNKECTGSCIWRYGECVSNEPVTPPPSKSPTTRPTSSPTKQPTDLPTKSPTACACHMTAFPTAAPIASTPDPTPSPTKAPIPSPTPPPVTCLAKGVACPLDPSVCCSGGCEMKGPNKKCA